MGLEEDMLLGRKIERVPIYTNVIDEEGSLVFYEKGFYLNVRGDSFKTPYSYITSLERVGTGPLGRVRVRLVVYDMFGNRFDKEIVLSEMAYTKLRHMWETAEK
ncbi:hypothetical protein J7K41_00335 [Candidatus Micrarchaeota archaeon]|nr:hypothetical protein [Candidatus Micrarchaeota archaeon]